MAALLRPKHCKSRWIGKKVLPMGSEGAREAQRKKRS